ncbi:MAG: 2Fe-2S iron-sulfur cluster-binding protein, partial [Pseudomonadota bacterium]
MQWCRAHSGSLKERRAMLDAGTPKTVTVTLDGAEVTVPEGTSIWDAAHGTGLRIPHLCHKPAPGYRP